MAVASVLDMTGAFSGIMGGVCGSGGKLKIVGHGKKIQTCVWLSLKSSALLDCISPLPFSALPSFLAPPTQAEVPLLSPHAEGHGGCTWAWLGVGGSCGTACPAIASSRCWRSSVLSPRRSLPSSRLSSGPMLLLPIFHKQNEN